MKTGSFWWLGDAFANEVLPLGWKLSALDDYLCSQLATHLSQGRPAVVGTDKTFCLRMDGSGRLEGGCTFE